MKISFFCKSNKPTVKDALKYLKKYYKEVYVYEGQRQDAFPKEAVNRNVDILISYISPWIIPEGLLKKTRYWNINFHPGSPEYPGIGCFNFALYKGEKSFGATAHLMEKKVDSGKIIGVKRFPISKQDSVYSLSLKTYKNMFLLFQEVIDSIVNNKTIPETSMNWKRIPYTRRELEALCRIEPEMPKEEVQKRIKATSYPGMPGAYIELFSHRFEYNSNEQVV